jgi:hypothetical protein
MLTAAHNLNNTGSTSVDKLTVVHRPGPNQKTATILHKFDYKAYNVPGNVVPVDLSLAILSTAWGRPLVIAMAEKLAKFSDSGHSSTA